MPGIAQLKLDGFAFKVDTLHCLGQIPRVWDFNMSLRAQFTIFGNFVVAKFSAAREGFKGGPILYLTSLCQHNYISQVNIQYHY